MACARQLDQRVGSKVVKMKANLVGGSEGECAGSSDSNATVRVTANERNDSFGKLSSLIIHLYTNKLHFILLY